MKWDTTDLRISWKIIRIIIDFLFFQKAQRPFQGTKTQQMRGWELFPPRVFLFIRKKNGWEHPPQPLSIRKI